MATRFGSVHAGSTDPHRAATCTCDKQTACVLGLCAARHLYLSASVSQTLPVRFRLDVFPIANEHSSVRSESRRTFICIQLLVII